MTVKQNLRFFYIKEYIKKTLRRFIFSLTFLGHFLVEKHFLIVQFSTCLEQLFRILSSHCYFDLFPAECDAIFIDHFDPGIFQLCIIFLFIDLL